MTRVSAGVDRRPVLADPALDERFRSDGFVVVPVLPADALEEVRRRVDEVVDPRGDGFFSLYRDEGEQQRRTLDALVREVLEPPAMELLVGQRAYIGSVLVKFPGGGTDLGPHQDWSFVDESRFVCGAVWTALQDTDRRNGGLYVVPGSHRWDVPYRGTPAMPSVEDVVPAEAFVDVEVPAGHAFVYHNALIHGSTDNLSSAPRTAMVLGFVSADAELVHFHVDDRGRRWRYRLRDGYSFTYQPPDAPTGDQVVAVEEWDAGEFPLPDEEVRTLRPADPHPARRRPWWRRR